LICAARLRELKRFLEKSGIGGAKSSGAAVYLVGAGTSDYIGQALAGLLRRLWGCEAWGVPSTSMLTNFEDFVFPQRPYLWISFSRSGESSEGLAVLQAALERYPNVRHLVVTCNGKGRMAEVCEAHPLRAFVLTLDDSANDRGLAMTGSFTNMVIAGQCLAHAFSFGEYDRPFACLREAGARFLPRAEEVAGAVAREDFTKACFVGSGALRAVAQESALKVMELTAGKIFAMSESTLGLRHGPMSALDRDTLFVSFVSRDARRQSYELDLMEEVHRKRLGKVRVAVAPDFIERLGGLADYVLPLDVPELGDEYRAPLDVMLAQLLGLFSSLRFGLKPDTPSPDGAISRVVSHVNIY
jgi:tagatose-6-phosphate ketose/aldose isomerase